MKAVLNVSKTFEIGILALVLPLACTPAAGRRVVDNRAGIAPGGQDGSTGAQNPVSQGKVVTNCQVIIAGGTTAALSAALTSAREGVSTCLVEPTDWPGGQLTASAVPAIDFAWHQTNGVNVKALGAKPENIPAEFQTWVTRMGNPGNCWVSRNCFEPKNLLQNTIEPAILKETKLTVFRNSVVKTVQTAAGKNGKKTITAVTVIRRTPKAGLAEGGYDVFLSQDMPDWYSSQTSARFEKEVLVLKSPDGTTPIVMDATELGEVMVLAGASFLQGLEKEEGKPETASETCGQSFVYPFVARMNAAVVNENVPGGAADHPEFYAIPSPNNWTKVWTYRRVLGTGSGTAAGQLSLQNWNPGNDYPYAYLLRTRAEATAEVTDWRGGVNYAALEAAERHSLGYYRWYKANAGGYASYVSLERGVLGTTHGLSKFPYVRDTRRSIGIENFIISAHDLQGTGTLGNRFPDRIGIGAYPMDIHGMHGSLGCSYPSYDHLTLPFHLPFRAHTNRDVGNLLVAGKTMAQSFMANAATRLQPIEFSSGVGAGAAAAFMSANKLTDTAQVYASRIGEVQNIVRKYAPIDWTF